MSRGSYRASYESLVDDAEYQALSPLAQAIFHTLKLKLGQYGIAVFYTSMLEDVHSRVSRIQIREALAELEVPKIHSTNGWIKVERNVVWLVNGLRFDPWITAENSNNRKGALAFTKGLPRLTIVDEFLAYYGLTTPSQPPPNPLPHPGGKHRYGNGNGAGNGNRERSSKTGVKPRRIHIGCGKPRTSQRQRPACLRR